MRHITRHDNSYHWTRAAGADESEKDSHFDETEETMMKRVVMARMLSLMRPPARKYVRGALCALPLCISAQVSFAQAPGWSRGQQNLAITYDECLHRAPGALRAEGYRIDYDAGDFAVGIKGVHTAVIICSPAPDAKMLVHIVVASNGEGGGTERQRLQAQMERPGSQPGLSPEGTWCREGDRSKPASIRQSGNSLTFTNENGNSSRGRFESSNTVVAIDWEGGLRGTFSSDGNRISWGNGTSWMRCTR